MIVSTKPVKDCQGMWKGMTVRVYCQRLELTAG